MVNNYEQNIESLTKKLKNVTGLLEQKVINTCCLVILLFYCICCRKLLRSSLFVFCEIFDISVVYSCLALFATYVHFA